MFPHSVSPLTSGFVMEAPVKRETQGERLIKELTQATERLSYISKEVEEKYRGITAPKLEDGKSTQDNEPQETLDNLLYFSKMQQQINYLNSHMERIQSVLERCEL
jgi:hypothetical protein